MDDYITIIVSNSYNKKFYLDKNLNKLPNEIKNEIKILFVKFTEKYGGIIEVIFDKINSDLIFRTYKNDNDFDYDEINVNYKMSKMQKDNEQLFLNIALFCKYKLNGIV